MPGRMAQLALIMIGAMMTVPANAQPDPNEATFWQSVRDSKDAAEFEAYLEAYPSGKFAPLARIRLKKLKTSAGVKDGPAVGSAASSEDKQPKIVKDRGSLGAKVKDAKDGAGAEVLEVQSGSAASAAGLKRGDIIQKIDDEAIQKARGLAVIISGTTPGEKVEMSLMRGGMLGGFAVQLSVTVGSFATHLIELAQNGNPDAMMQIGRYLSKGDVFEKDPALATVWYRRAKDVWKKGAEDKKRTTGSNQ